METVEENVILAVPARMAYERWAGFGSFPDFMSGTGPASGGGEIGKMWRPESWGAALAGPPDQIAWRTLEGRFHRGVVVFTPLDPGNSRVSVRIEWVPEAVADVPGAALSISSAGLRAGLRRFKVFIEA